MNRPRTGRQASLKLCIRAIVGSVSSAQLTDRYSAVAQDPRLGASKLPTMVEHQGQQSFSNPFALPSRSNTNFFSINPEIAHHILDLAVAEKNLDGTQIAGRPVDDRRLGSPEREGAIFASHQANPGQPFIDKSSILAAARGPVMIDPAWKD